MLEYYFDMLYTHAHTSKKRGRPTLIMGDIQARQFSEKEYIQAMADAYLNTDLNARFIHNRAATLLPPAPDDGIHGIFLGDILIVDRSIKPKPGYVILAEVDGQYCLRRLLLNKRNLYLADDKGYIPPWRVSGQEYFHGVVTANIHPQI